MSFNPVERSLTMRDNLQEIHEAFLVHKYNVNLDTELPPDLESIATGYIDICHHFKDRVDVPLLNESIEYFELLKSSLDSFARDKEHTEAIAAAHFSMYMMFEVLAEDVMESLFGDEYVEFRNGF